MSLSDVFIILAIIGVVLLILYYTPYAKKIRKKLNKRKEAEKFARQNNSKRLVTSIIDKITGKDKASSIKNGEGNTTIIEKEEQSNEQKETEFSESDFFQ